MKSAYCLETVAIRANYSRAGLRVAGHELRGMDCRLTFTIFKCMNLIHLKKYWNNIECEILTDFSTIRRKA